MVVVAKRDRSHFHPSIFIPHQSLSSECGSEGDGRIDKLSSSNDIPKAVCPAWVAFTVFDTSVSGMSYRTHTNAVAGTPPSKNSDYSDRAYSDNDYCAQFSFPHTMIPEMTDNEHRGFDHRLLGT